MRFVCMGEKLEAHLSEQLFLGNAYGDIFAQRRHSANCCQLLRCLSREHP